MTGEATLPGAPILVTERLILRPPTMADFDAYAALAADPGVMQHLGGAVPRSTAWRQWAAVAGSWALHGFGFFSMIERSTGTWVGRAGPWAPDGWPVPEIGYAVAADFAGKGYAYEACIAAIDFAIDRLGWTEIAHTISPDNLPSQRLAARLGAVNRGPTRLPPPFEDERVDLWAQSVADWHARRAQPSG